MRDFTLSAYRKYLEAIRKHIPRFLTFEEFLSCQSAPSSYCLLRHDVDRKPQNAQNMAKLEAEMGIKATYYFRIKSNVFQPAVIRSISEMGHEIGYHYESLSDTDGDLDLALKDFEKHLAQMRSVVNISTISMHGRPLKPHDNRDIWKDGSRKNLLKEKFNLLGEVYLDINYSDIAYINDTGRNWMSGKSNRRDKVDSNIAADFESGEALLDYLQNEPHSKMIFQIHPERWSNDLLDWSAQLIKDRGINFVKSIIAMKEGNSV